MTSGKLDYGMLAVTDTYVCKTCRAIVAVCIGEYGKIHPKEEIALKKIKSVNDLDFYNCPNYGSDTNLEKWNNRKRPCPKCDGKRDKDEKWRNITLGLTKSIT